MNAKGNDHHWLLTIQFICSQCFFLFYSIFLSLSRNTVLFETNEQWISIIPFGFAFWCPIKYGFSGAVFDSDCVSLQAWPFSCQYKSGDNSVTTLIIRRLQAGCSTSYPSDQPLNVKIIFGFSAIVFYIVKEKCIYLNLYILISLYRTRLLKKINTVLKWSWLPSPLKQNSRQKKKGTVDKMKLAHAPYNCIARETGTRVLEMIFDFWIFFFKLENKFLHLAALRLLTWYLTDRIFSKVHAMTRLILI